ncbi:glycosyltransferase [Mameliella sp.]|uniref:glycosyltransferase n=1 Tax=Mameliella sp. TaxID=1924940 RepID=UPI003BA9089A
MKIVTLSTYPYSQPFHGGQRRLDAIARILRAAGHEVFALPLFFPGQYSRHDATEAITGLHDTLRAEMLSAGLREDLHLPSLLQAGVPAFDAARHRLFEIRPDILHVEQPWLFPLVDRLLEVLPDAPRISVVYGSQNVESDLMPERFRDEARAIEQAAVRRADLVVAVSAEDARALTEMRAPGQETPVVLAPNGCWPQVQNSSLPRHVEEDYLLIVGSAHAPNAEGYWDVIGEIPGCIPPDARVVVAGEVGLLLQEDPRYRHFRRLNDHLVHITGRVEEDELQALLTHAKGICLPIKSGGGTNLKTAEALLTLKPVIAMRTAFRGFEEAMSLGGVHVAEDESEFRAHVRALFAGTLTGSRSPDDVAQYTWEAALAALPPAYARLGAA